MKRRRVIQLVLLLVLLISGGAIVNVAVAWGHSIFIDAAGSSPRSAEFALANGQVWYLDVWQHRGSALIHALYSPKDYVNPDPDLPNSSDSKRGPDVPQYDEKDFDEYLNSLTWRNGPDAAEYDQMESEELPTISFTEAMPWWTPYSQADFVGFGSTGGYKCLVEARGFPVRSFWQEFELRHLSTGGPILDIEWKVRGGIPFAYGTFTPRSIPLRPIWPGFAINTIFYAAILWVVFFPPGIVKRTLRRRRGQCPACAYPVGTSNVCTECGHALRREADVIPSARS